jgi:hypothetical protein
MLAHPESARDEGWGDRILSIPGLVRSATEKFADEVAPYRRSLARLAIRLLREQESSAAVRAAVLAEAETYGIAVIDAERIVAWAVARRGWSE